MHLGIAPYVCLVLLCLQCKEGSCFCFCSHENLGGSTVFLWSLGPGSILSHCEYAYSENDALGLSAIAWSPLSCHVDSFPSQTYYLPFILAEWSSCAVASLFMPTYPASQKSSWMPSLPPQYLLTHQSLLSCENMEISLYVISLTSL